MPGLPSHRAVKLQADVNSIVADSINRFGTGSNPVVDPTKNVFFQDVQAQEKRTVENATHSHKKLKRNAFQLCLSMSQQKEKERKEREEKRAAERAAREAERAAKEAAMTKEAAAVAAAAGENGDGTQPHRIQGSGCYSCRHLGCGWLRLNRSAARSVLHAHVM